VRGELAVGLPRSSTGQESGAEALRIETGSDTTARPGRNGRMGAVTGKRWPDLFVAGAPRCGTSSIWSYLDQHPQIFMSRLKEPHFFTDRKPRNVPTVSDEAVYLRLFDGAAAGQLRGEASPTYLASPQAPGRIARVNPDARIVVVLRNPVARAYSAYWHKVRYGGETRTFLEAVRPLQPVPGGRTCAPSYVRGGLYAEPIERYLDTFGEHLHVLFQEELAADTRGELRRILEFLGVDATATDRIRLDVRNATALPRNRVVRRLYSSPRLRSLGERAVPVSLQPRLERLLLRRDGVPPMEPEARRFLEGFYAAEPAALERLLGRPVPWAAKPTA